MSAPDIWYTMDVGEGELLAREPYFTYNTIQ